MRLLRCAETSADWLRIVIEASRVAPTLGKVCVLEQTERTLLNTQNLVFMILGVYMNIELL